MQAETVIRVEKNVDQAASVLFGVACGYSGFLLLADAERMGAAAVMALAGAVALATYFLTFRLLSSVQPDARKLPVRAFRLREVEPLEPEDFEDFESFESFESSDFPTFERADVLALLPAPSDHTPELAELLLTDSYEPEPQAEPEQERESLELELTEVVETEAPVEEQALLAETETELEQPRPQLRVVSLFDAAAMPTPGQLGSKINRHLQREPSAMQSAEAAQALQDALAELRRAIPSRRG